MNDSGVNGLVEVICGGMFSGKTEELLRRLKRAQIGRQKVQVFKPAIDNRYAIEFVQSHNANRMDARPIHHSQEILKNLEERTRVVGIDEAQFFDDSLVQVVEQLAFRGLRVIIAGLDLDFRGKPFGPMPSLMCIAESVTKLSAVCVVCGNPATRSQRLRAIHTELSANEVIAVGAKELYEARCRFCHEPDGSEEQPSLGLTINPSSDTAKNQYA